jgi:hypothetical protein
MSLGETQTKLTQDAATIQALQEQLETLKKAAMPPSP